MTVIVIPTYETPLEVGNNTNKTWYFFWNSVGKIVNATNIVSLTPGSYTNSNVTVNSNGVISSVASGTPSGTGTVTSVAIGSTSLSITGTNPVTTSGVINVDLTSTQLTDLGLAASSVQSVGSSNLTIAGTATAPTVSLSGTQVTNIGLGGTALQPGGAVTSVGLASTDFTVSGSPVTTSGNITANLAVQAGVVAASYTYSSITVNSKGVITAISSGTAPATAANPSGLIGMTAVNGVAATFDRSDSTHAINPAILPTWTGAHIFSPGSGTAITVNAATGQISLQLNPSNSASVGLSITDPGANATNFRINTTNTAVTLQCNGTTTNLTIQTPGATNTVTSAGLWQIPKSPMASATTQMMTGLANFKASLSTSANATLTADAALTVTCNETGWYDVNAYLVFFEATAGTGGFQFDFNAGGATIANPSFAVNGFSTAAFSNSAITSISTATGIGTIGTASATPSWVKVQGTIQVTGTGSFGIRWAQNTILAIDPTTLAAGSKIILTKIG
jgi:hypothetical protein